MSNEFIELVSSKVKDRLQSITNLELFTVYANCRPEDEEEVAAEISKRLNSEDSNNRNSFNYISDMSLISFYDTILKKAAERDKKDKKEKDKDNKK